MFLSLSGNGVLCWLILLRIDNCKISVCNSLYCSNQDFFQRKQIPKQTQTDIKILITVNANKRSSFNRMLNTCECTLKGQQITEAFLELPSAITCLHAIAAERNRNMKSSNLLGLKMTEYFHTELGSPDRGLKRYEKISIKTQFKNNVVRV